MQRGIVVGLFVLALGLGSADVARAGDYTVRSCKEEAGSPVHPVDGWTAARQRRRRDDRRVVLPRRLAVGAAARRPLQRRAPTSGGSSTRRPGRRSSTTGSRARRRSARCRPATPRRRSTSPWPAQVGRHPRALLPARVQRARPPRPGGAGEHHHAARADGRRAVAARRRPVRRHAPARTCLDADSPPGADTVRFDIHAAQITLRDSAAPAVGGAHRPARRARAHPRGHDDRDRAGDRRRRRRRLVHARGRRPGGGQRRRARLPGRALHAADALSDRASASRSSSTRPSSPTAATRARVVAPDASGNATLFAGPRRAGRQPPPRGLRRRAQLRLPTSAAAALASRG